MYIFQIYHTHRDICWQIFKKNNTLSCQICVPLADGSYMLQLVPLVLRPAYILIHIHHVHKEITKQLDRAALIYGV